MKRGKYSVIGDILYNSSIYKDITVEDSALYFKITICFQIGFIGILYYFSVYYSNKSAMIACWILSICYTIIVISKNVHRLYIFGIGNSKLRLTFITLFFLLGFAWMISGGIMSKDISFIDFIINAFYYLCMMFFIEEFIYRGILWPRLVVLYGKNLGTILCGILWGFMHLVSEYYLGGTPINFNTIFNCISSGILGNYIFAFMYAYTNNIFFPTIIHASLHFFM